MRQPVITAFLIMLRLSITLLTGKTGERSIKARRKASLPPPPHTPPRVDYFHVRFIGSDLSSSAKAVLTGRARAGGTRSGVISEIAEQISHAASINVNYHRPSNDVTN